MWALSIENTMTDEAVFLALIKADPADNAARLVYADWLDERGRPGGDFLRTDCEIASLDPADFERREQEREMLSREGVIDSVLPDSMDTYFWQRSHLVAKLRGTTRDLDDDWMAAVSRVPIDEINARVWEIQSWLRKRVTVDEVLTRMTDWDRKAEIPKSLWARLRKFFRGPDTPVSQQNGPHVCTMREWIEEHLRPGDELWEYDTAGESWENLCGEMGYAIVRNGKVVEFEMLLMN